jgi:predicted membrane chloride channel (bestrophin family)
LSKNCGYIVKSSLPIFYSMAIVFWIHAYFYCFAIPIIC